MSAQTDAALVIGLHADRMSLHHGKSAAMFLSRYGIVPGRDYGSLERWHDRLRGRGCTRPRWTAGYEPPPLTDTQVATYVGMLGVLRLIELVPRLHGKHVMRQLGWHAFPDYRLYTLTKCRNEYGGHARVLADALLVRGHWMGEPLALALNRPSGKSRSHWRMLSALAFVHAVPSFGPKPTEPEPAKRYMWRVPPTAD